MPRATLNKHEIYYEDVGQGQGSPIVLLHGASTSSAWFEELIVGLHAEFRVIAPDLRGMGRSQRIQEMPPTAWNDDLMALISELGVEDFHLVGTSLGARVALRTALDHPNRVKTLTSDAVVLYDTPEGSAAIEELFGKDIPDDLAESVERDNGSDWRQVLDAFLSIRQTPGFQEYFDFSGKLGDLSCPAFVCRGDIDNIPAPIAHSLQAHDQFPDSRLWISPATPFSALHFAPPSAVEQVRAFLMTSSGDTG